MIGQLTLCVLILISLQSRLTLSHMQTFSDASRISHICLKKRLIVFTWIWKLVIILGQKRIIISNLSQHVLLHSKSVLLYIESFHIVYPNKIKAVCGRFVVCETRLNFTIRRKECYEYSLTLTHIPQICRRRLLNRLD